MITLKGYYDNGRIKLFGEAPAKAGDVLVVFTDEERYKKNLEKHGDEPNSDWEFFKSFRGSVKFEPDFDYKDERAKAVMEEYTKLIRKMR